MNTADSVKGIIAAAIALVITLMQTVQQVRARALTGVASPLSTIILRDGTSDVLRRIAG